MEHMYNANYDVSKIKLIIWDLDETLWEGTLSEGDIVLPPKDRMFLYQSLDRGIVHSICSKNDFRVAESKLKELNVWKCFVFPSINWSNKGVRIKNLIKNMGLRAQNVLFIDDNISNLKEAIYFNDGIMTVSAENLLDVIKDIAKLPEKDKENKRLNQYRLLERKNKESTQYESNDEFLMNSNICVEIKEDCYDCVDRIVDLIQRSNQLNYTKNRMSKDEIMHMLKDDDFHCGCVSAKDKFGDYGVVGFFSVKDNEAIQFAFSCRTLGMRIEQYVYMILKCPKINVVGDVVNQLNTTEIPLWINNKTSGEIKIEKSCIDDVTLLKGPCDMEQIFSFIKKTENVLTEFTYVGRSGESVEGCNHTAQICTALSIPPKHKKNLIDEFCWFDKDAYTTSLSESQIDFFVLSMLSDCNLGVYQNKNDGTYIALCEDYYDITDRANWPLYINGEIFTSFIKFTESELQHFSDNYVKIENLDGEMTIKWLDEIYNLRGKNLKKFILLLGSEKEYIGKNITPSYKDRHLLHKNLNQKLTCWALDKDNVVLLRFDDYIQSKDDFLDTINHFKKRVYYELSMQLSKELTTSGISVKNKQALFVSEFMQSIMMSNFVKKIIVLLQPIVRKIKNKYKLS